MMQNNMITQNSTTTHVQEEKEKMATYKYDEHEHFDIVDYCNVKGLA